MFYINMEFSSKNTNYILRLSIFALLVVLGLEKPNVVLGQSEPAAQRMELVLDNCTANVNRNRYIGVAVVSMYKGTWLNLNFICPDKVKSFKITSIQWRLLSRKCVNTDTEWKCNLLSDLAPDNTIEYLNYFHSNDNLAVPRLELECSNTNRTLHFPFYAGEWYIPTPSPPTKPPETIPSGPSSSTITQSTTKAEKLPGHSRRKREVLKGAPSSPSNGNPGGPSGPAGAPTPPDGKPGGPAPATTGQPATQLFAAPSDTPGAVSSGVLSGLPGAPSIDPNAPVGPPASTGPTIPSETTTKGKTPSPPSGAILRTESDGVYWFIIRIVRELEPDETIEKLDVDLMPLAKHGHISAIDWPLLPFYAVMFVVYALYLIVWLTLCCCYRKDILQIQYWITGVIFIGLLEKTVFLGEFDTLNRTGYPSGYGALVLGELLSCGKKALARLLVIIVSFGFGIVKPRLGSMLYKVLAMGAVYFIACSVEGLVRINNSKTDISRSQNIAFIILSIIDVAICWWIFSSLVLTMKTLRLRRNVVKLSLYRHFTNTLIFSVLASLVFMIWTVKEYRLPTCVEDWKELWVEQAFWHLLFSILLLVILFLWRPSANNQRYAYSHLQDAEDDESEEPMINTAFDGMKLRSKGGQENGSKLYHRGETEDTDEDLKWIEENIPTSLADSALPSMLDSDEEIALTQNELRKMH